MIRLEKWRYNFTKKIISFIVGIASSGVVIFFVILIACLTALDFFDDGEEADINFTDYVVNNYQYANEYTSVVNKHIKNNNGYVPLSRIIYFYSENNQLAFDEIYLDNLDVNLKRMKSINEVCLMDKYKNMNVCKNISISDSSTKIFSKPIDFSKITVTSFFMQQRMVYGKADVHPAWDLAANNQTPVYSVCDGTIETVKFKYKSNVIDKKGGAGNQIKLKCGISGTTYHIIYGHLYPNSAKVKAGDYVESGEQIASVGTTGYSTGPHLHFEVYLNNKNRIDGMDLVKFN